MIEIEKNDDVDFDVEVQLSSPQWSLQPILQILQEGPELRRSKCQTQMLFREGNIYREWEHPTNTLQNPL